MSTTLSPFISATHAHVHMPDTTDDRQPAVQQAVPDTAPIDGYDDWTVDDLRENIDDYDADAIETLVTLYGYERANKGRVTAMRVIRSRLNTVTRDGLAVDVYVHEPDKPGARATLVHGDAAEDAPAAGAPADRVPIKAADLTGTVLVRPTRAGYIAGTFFDYVETRELPRDMRVEAAIDAGDLVPIRGEADE